MAPAKPARRAAELRAAIEKANYEYHVLDAPTISDEQYDALLRELLAIESAHPTWSRPSRRRSASARRRPSASGR